MWDGAAGVGKGVASTAARHGVTIDTAHDLYLYLKQHHSTVSASHHEALNQIDHREFHFFPTGTFLAYHPRKPRNPVAVKPYYCFGVRRTDNDDNKSIFMRKHFCPCPSCTIGEYHECLHKEYLGTCNLFYRSLPPFPTALNILPHVQVSGRKKTWTSHTLIKTLLQSSGMNMPTPFDLH